MSHECSLANSTLDARCSLPVSHSYRGNAISTLVKHSHKFYAVFGGRAMALSRHTHRLRPYLPAANTGRNDNYPTLPRSLPQRTETLRSSCKA